MADAAKPSEVKFLKSNPPDVWDLAKLEASVNSTSQRAVAQWLAYLSLWGYLFFTTLSITHRDLILLTPVKLPLIGVELGVREYFWAGPPLFWVFHLYLVRKITVLARDVAFYRAVMKRIVSSAAAREPLYRRLDAFFLTRLLGYREQGRLLRWLDGGIAVATVVVMPLALMVAFQLYYLAYHDPDATDWHRGWLVADVLLLAIPLLWRLWGRSREASGLVNGKRRRLRGWVVVIGKTLGLTLAFGGCVAFSLAIATFPDDRMDWALSAVGLSGKNHPLSSLRVLAPRDTDFVNDEKLDKVQWTVDLRGRDLRGANLSGADLRKARMTGVKLQGADLRQSDLRQADLSSASMDEINIDRCQCQGVNMKNSILRGGRLSYSNFNGADLSGVFLIGSYMHDSSFKFSNMKKSHLEGVISENSEFQGAMMDESDFSGSILTGSRFDSASIKRSYFRAADMKGVSLWGVKIIEPYKRESENKNYFLYSENLERINYNIDRSTNPIKIDEWIESIPSLDSRRAIRDNAYTKYMFYIYQENSTKNDYDYEVRNFIEEYGNQKNKSINERSKFLIKLSCNDAPYSVNGVRKRVMLGKLAYDQIILNYVSKNYSSANYEFADPDNIDVPDQISDEGVNVYLISNSLNSPDCIGKKFLMSYGGENIETDFASHNSIFKDISTPPEYPQ